MGIFNEQSFDHPFAKGIQGAPGVGFSLTADGNYDMNNKKLTNVGAPSANTDAATKKYVDENSSGSATTSRLTVDSNIDMNDRYRITNLITPQDSKDPATKYYVDNTFLDRDGSYPMKGNLNMDNNKIVGLATPTSNTDAATKKYVDDSKVDGRDFLKLDGTRKMTGVLDMGFHRLANIDDPIGPQDAMPVYYSAKFLNLDGSYKMKNNIDMNNNKIINLKPPTSDTNAATKKYVDDSIPNTSSFIKKDGSVAMTGNLDMNNNEIKNIPAPNGPKQPTPLAFTDLKYLHVAGTNKMTNNLNMDNKKIINLRPPTSNTDAATKKYVDDNTGAPDLSDYLEKDGTVTMTGNLNVGNNKIINLSKPTQDNEAATKNYVDKLVHHTAVQPSHYKNEFAYLMSSGAQWTDEIDTGISFAVNKIDDLPPNKENFHDYNHKVIYMTIYKNRQLKYKYKMGINFYRLTANTDYTLCLEILNTDYILWNNTQISIDKGTSRGLSIRNVGIRKLSYSYTDSNGKQNLCIIIE